MKAPALCLVIRIFSMILIVFLLVSNQTKAQEDFKFLPDDVRIIESLNGLPSSHGDGNGKRYFEYYVIGDTLIDGFKYQLLGTKNLGFSTTNNKIFVRNDTDFGLFGALRKDSTKVFFRLLKKVNSEINSRNPDGHWNHALINVFPLNEERLVYDFNMDSVETQNWGSRFIKVPEIDTIVTDNGIEKLRYMFYDGYEAKDPMGSDFWIQDIGTSRGLLGTFAWWDLENIPTLNYFCSEELSYHYVGSSFVNCNFLAESTVPIQDTSDSSQDTIQNDQDTVKSGIISLFPNPTDGFFMLKNGTDRVIKQLELVNSIGQVIERKEFDAPLEPGTPIFSMHNQPAGWYFLRIFFKDGSLISKGLVVK